MSGALKARTVSTLFDEGRGTGYFTKSGCQCRSRRDCSSSSRASAATGSGSRSSWAPWTPPRTRLGTTQPGVVVEGSLTHNQYDSPARVYAVSDALGAFEIAFPGSEDVVPGDLVELRIQLVDGTWIVRRLPVAP